MCHVQMQPSLVGGNTGHCGLATYWSVPGVASAIGVMEGSGLEFADGAGPRVAGAEVSSPGGSCVNP